MNKLLQLLYAYDSAVLHDNPPTYEPEEFRWHCEHCHPISTLVRELAKQNQFADTAAVLTANYRLASHHDVSQIPVLVGHVQAALVARGDEVPDPQAALTETASNLLMRMLHEGATANHPKTKAKICEKEKTTVEGSRRAWQRLKDLGYYDSADNAGVFLTSAGKKRAEDCVQEL